MATQSGYVGQIDQEKDMHDRHYKCVTDIRCS
jgi:hypothetical protein